MNHANKTLGEFLSSKNETIRRNALSILKQLTREDREYVERYTCPKYGEPVLPDEKGMCSLCGKHKA